MLCHDESFDYAQFEDVPDLVEEKVHPTPSSNVRTKQVPTPILPFFASMCSIRCHAWGVQV